MQIVPDPAAEDPAQPQLVFYLDGAHTPESMEACAEWFAGADNSAFQGLLLTYCFPCVMVYDNLQFTSTYGC